jgi:hypothetical protein
MKYQVIFEKKREYLQGKTYEIMYYIQNITQTNAQNEQTGRILFQYSFPLSFYRVQYKHLS